MLNLFNRKKQVIAISPSIIVFSTLFFGVVYFLFTIREILTILLLGFIVMVALSPAVNRLEKKIKSRPLSIIIVYLLLILFLSSMIALLVPPLAAQLTQLMRSIQLPYLQEELANLKFTTQEINQLISDYGSSVTALLSIISSTFRGFFSFLTLLVISFYLMIDEPHLYKKVGWFTNNKHHFKIAKEFMIDIERQLGNWIRGQTIVMLIVGLFTYVGLELIGIPYALPLGMLAFMLEILPNLGPTLAAIPGILLAWLHGDHVTAIVVTVFYIFLQQAESNILTPRVMKASANVNPLVSIVSILSGFIIGGVIGSLLAIPIYILLRTMFGYYRKYQDRLSPDW